MVLVAGWTYAGGNLTSGKQAGGKEVTTILHRYHFTSTLKRMTVIVKVCLKNCAGKRTLLACLTQTRAKMTATSSKISCVSEWLMLVCRLRMSTLRHQHTGPW